MNHLGNLNKKKEAVHFTDHELLQNTKNLVKEERHVLSQILKNLKEVERRKLFSDLGYKSLFEYTVKELQYSEGQAGRRIQAMRLINELPEIEEKIEDGSLSLSNISQAQSFFRELEKMDIQPITEPEHTSEKSKKIELLRKLENKSTREAEKLLLELNPKMIKVKERERALPNDLTEVRFVIDEELKQKLEEFRSLLGPKGSYLSFSELISEMTNIGIEALRKKKFGSQNSKKLNFTPAPELLSRPDLVNVRPLKSNSNSQIKNRYIPKSLKTKIWIKDNGECQICKSKQNLNFDHILPHALGGESTEENLRLLCHHCNQRQAIKKFGFEKIKTYHSQRP